MIEVTGIDLKRFTKKVYELSSSTDKKDTFETLTDTSMGVVLQSGGVKNWNKFVLDMKIVKGRACNMTIFESHEGRWFIQDLWADHSQEQLKELLEYCGVKANIKES